MKDNDVIDLSISSVRINGRYMKENVHTKLFIRWQWRQQSSLVRRESGSPATRSGIDKTIWRAISAGGYNGRTVSYVVSLLRAFSSSLRSERETRGISSAIVSAVTTGRNATCAGVQVNYERIWFVPANSSAAAAITRRKYIREEQREYTAAVTRVYN